MWFVARLAFTVAAFAWILRDGALREQMASLPVPSVPAWLGAALVFAGIAEGAVLLRFWLCARIAGVPVSLRRAAALHFLGLYTSLFLPGVAGGDALKVGLLAAQFPQRRLGGLLVVMMDRVTGFIVIVAWLAAVAWARADWFAASVPAERALRVVLLITGPAAGMLVFWFLLSRTRLMRTRISRFPFREFILRCEAGFDAFIAGRARAVAALSLSIVAFGAHFLVFACAGRAFGADVATGDMLAVMPLVDVITMLPVTIAGLGLREGMFGTVVAPLCGIGAGLAVVMSLAGFLVSCAWALPGAFVLFCSGPKPSSQNA